MRTTRLRQLSADMSRCCHGRGWGWVVACANQSSKFVMLPRISKVLIMLLSPVVLPDTAPSPPTSARRSVRRRRAPRGRGGVGRRLCVAGVGRRGTEVGADRGGDLARFWQVDAGAGAADHGGDLPLVGGGFLGLGLAVEAEEGDVGPVGGALLVRGVAFDVQAADWQSAASETELPAARHRPRRNVRRAWSAKGRAVAVKGMEEDGEGQRHDETSDRVSQPPRSGLRRFTRSRIVGALYFGFLAFPRIASGSLQTPR